MRIDRLSMQHFRCFADQNVDLQGARTLFLGDLASGKSTTFDAPRWVLNGVCRGLNAAGAGVDGLVKTNAPKGAEMVVSCQVTHAGVTRIVTRSFDGRSSTLKVKGVGKTKGFEGSSSDQQKALYEWLGVTRQSLEAILDAEVFFEMAHGDAKKLLLGMLRVEIEIPEIKDDAGVVLQVGEVITFDDLEKRYKSAFDGRRDATRDLKAILVPREPEESVGDIDGTITKLDGLRAELKKLTVDRAKAQGAGTERALHLHTLETQLSVTRSKKGPKTSAVLDGEKDQVQTQIDTIERSIKDAQDGLTLPAVNEPTFESLTAAAKALAEHRPAQGCVLGGGVKCPVKRDKFDEAAALVDREAAGLKAVYEARAEAMTEIGRLQGVLASKRAEWERLHDLAGDEQVIEEKEASLVASIERLGEVVAPGPTPMDEQITLLDDRILKGEGVLLKKNDLRFAHDTYNKAKASYEKKADEVAELERQVDLYGPTGIRVQALDQGKAQFEAAINGALGMFGYQLEISTDPWGIVVTDQKNGPRAWVMLSTSEQLRVSIAMQCAMAIASGLGFTMIDKVDLLLAKERKALFLVLENTPLEQVWVARSFEPTADLPTPSGTQIVRL